MGVAVATCYGAWVDRWVVAAAATVGYCSLVDGTASSSIATETPPDARVLSVVLHICKTNQ